MKSFFIFFFSMALVLGATSTESAMELYPNSVPEPAILLLFGIGLIGLFFLAKYQFFK